MAITLIFLIISAFLLILLFIVRISELKKDKFIAPNHVRSFADKKIKNFLLAVLRITVKIKKIIYREVSLIPNRIFKITYRIWLRVKRNVDKFYSRLRG